MSSVQLTTSTALTVIDQTTDSPATTYQASTSVSPNSIEINSVLVAFTGNAIVNTGDKKVWSILEMKEITRQFKGVLYSMFGPDL